MRHPDLHFRPDLGTCPEPPDRSSRSYSNETVSAPVRTVGDATDDYLTQVDTKSLTEINRLSLRGL